MSIERDLAATLSELLVNEAPNNAVPALLGWMTALRSLGGQTSLDIVEREAESHAQTEIKGSLSHALYVKITGLAREASCAFKAKNTSGYARPRVIGSRK